MKRSDAKTFAQYMTQVQPENIWNELRRCPHCGNGAVLYDHYDEHGNELKLYVNCSCTWCDAQWVDRVEE